MIFRAMTPLVFMTCAFLLTDYAAEWVLASSIAPQFQAIAILLIAAANMWLFHIWWLDLAEEVKWRRHFKAPLGSFWLDHESYIPHGLYTRR